MSSSGGAAQAAGRRARPQSTRTPPTPRAGVSTRTQPPFPRTEEPAQATLLPLEVESFFREVGAGRPPTVHFSLPFTAADGRQTLLAMPGYTFAVPTPDTEQLALDTFSFLTLDRSEIGPEYKTPYIPRAPTYMPANATTNRPAMLVDEASGWIWPVLPYADFVNEHLPWVNSKRAHSVTGSPFRAPTFNPLEIDSGGFPGTMPEFELPGRGTPEPAPTGHNFFDNMTPDSEPAFTVLGAAARSLWGGGEYSRTAASRAAQASSSQAPSGAARAAPPPEATDAAVPGAGASPAAQPDSASTTAVSSTPQTESTSAPLNRNQRRRLAQEQQKAQQQQRQQPALAQATSRAQPDEQQPISSAQLSARFSQQQAEGRAAPSGQGLKRATLLPEDEATLVETMSGMPVPTTYYSLPFTASDGRQALLAVAGDLVPWVSPREVRSPNAGRRPPGWTGQSGEKEPWVPTAPYFVPANASPDNIPWLWDDVGHFAWPIMELDPEMDLPRGPLLMPWENTRQCQYMTGPAHGIGSRGHLRGTRAGGAGGRGQGRG